MSDTNTTHAPGGTCDHGTCCAWHCQECQPVPAHVHKYTDAATEPKRYGITATVEVAMAEGGWGGMMQVPYFELNANVQGMVSEEHARKVAEDIILTGVRVLGKAVEKVGRVVVHVTAVEVAR